MPSFMTKEDAEIGTRDAPLPDVSFRSRHSPTASISRVRSVKAASLQTDGTASVAHRA